MKKHETIWVSGFGSGLVGVVLVGFFGLVAAPIAVVGMALMIISKRFTPKVFGDKPE